MRRFKSLVVVTKGGPTPQIRYKPRPADKRRPDIAEPSPAPVRGPPQRRISRSLPTSPPTSGISSPRSVTNKQTVDMATSQATAAAAAMASGVATSVIGGGDDKKFGGGSAVSTMNRSIKRAKAKSRMFLVYHP